MRETLVLNASFEPLSTVTLQPCGGAGAAGQGRRRAGPPRSPCACGAVDLPVPRVIRLCRYVRVPFRRRAPWSRRGVLVRDQHRCAYCGRRATTVDHVVPRSHGGADTWLNTVASCAEDNHRKADRTPEQAGMPLLHEPFEPTPADALLLALRAGERARRCRSGWRRSLPRSLTRPALSARLRTRTRAPALRASAQQQLDDRHGADRHDDDAQRGRRQSAADLGAELAADRGADGDQQDGRPVEVGDEEEEDARRCR